MDRVICPLQVEPILLKAAQLATSSAKFNLQAHTNNGIDLHKSVQFAAVAFTAVCHSFNLHLWCIVVNNC